MRRHDRATSSWFSSTPLSRPERGPRPWPRRRRPHPALVSFVIAGAAVPLATAMAPPTVIRSAAAGDITPAPPVVHGSGVGADTLPVPGEAVAGAPRAGSAARVLRPAVHPASGARTQLRRRVLGWRHVTQTRMVAVGPTTSGVASWYTGGGITADGEAFDPQALTAASLTWPFNTQLQVCASGNCVQVRVNDRGPYVTGRVLDLTQAAAADLGYLTAGTAQVSITPVAEQQVSVLLPVSESAPTVVQPRAPGPMRRYDRLGPRPGQPSAAV